jgi:hypothetical protein
MYVVARTTQQAVHKEQRPSDSAMARRMTLIVATDAACWMPIILLGVLSLGGITVPPQVNTVCCSLRFLNMLIIPVQIIPLIEKCFKNDAEILILSSKENICVCEHGLNHNKQ